MAQASDSKPPVPGPSTATTPSGAPASRTPDPAVKADPRVAAQTAASDKATTNPPGPTGAVSPVSSGEHPVGGPGVLSTGRTNDPHSDDRKRLPQDAVRNAPLPPGSPTAEQDALRRTQHPDAQVSDAGVRVEYAQFRDRSNAHLQDVHGRVIGKLENLRGVVESMVDRIKAGTVLGIQHMNEIHDAISNAVVEARSLVTPRAAGAPDPAPQAADKLHGQAGGHRPLGQPDTMGTSQPSTDFPGGQAPSPMPGRTA